MSETLTEQSTPDNEVANTETVAQQNQQAILAGELSVDDLDESQLRELEALEYPDRVEDVDEARAIADATTVQETAMARSRIVSKQAGEDINALEATRVDENGNKVSFIKNIIIDSKIKRIENETSEISTQNTDYWDELTAQRDKKAAEASETYAAERQAAVDSARADVDAALNKE